MTEPDRPADRRRTCLNLGTRLALLDDRALTRMLRAAKPTRGWGATRAVQLDGVPMFVKSLPLTARELARPYSTRNHYRLPCFYNYGVGSAGFGAFRELAAHIKTTHWVLSGAVDGFPLMYHHRILPRVDRPRPADPEALDRYVRRWNGSRAVRRYIEDRRTATHEIAVFLEWIPHALRGWLPANTHRAADAFAALRRTLNFAGARGFLHFDAHAQNIVTDGEGFYLTDFGLALDADFDLTDRERAFFAAHRHYDHGECILGLLGPLLEAGRSASAAAQRAFVARFGPIEPATMLDHLEAIVEANPFGLDPGYGRLALEHHAVMRHMADFFAALAPDPRKRARFDDAALRPLLAALPPIDGVSIA